MVQIYFLEQHQRVVINGENFDWGYVKAVVPQRSFLGLLFLIIPDIYINDLVDIVNSEIRLCVDDTTVMWTIQNHLQKCKTKILPKCQNASLGILAQ